MRTIDLAKPLPRVSPEALEETDFRVTVREADGKGQGVFTAEPLAEGEVAIVGKPVSESPNRTWKSLQIDIDRHITIDAPFEFVNHSCGPNCGIKPNRHGGYDLVAMKALAAGEEITFDYCMTEWLCIGFEACCCSSDQCRKIIKGAKFVPLEKLKEYGGYTAPYFRSLLPELGAVESPSMVRRADTAPAPRFF